MSSKTVEVPPKLSLTAILTGSITIVTSIIYVSLCIAALVYSFQCKDLTAENFAHSSAWWRLIYHVYFIKEDCATSLAVTSITQPDTVFVLVAVTLGFSALTGVAGIVLIVAVKNVELFKNITTIVIVYIIGWLTSLAVDLTFGTFLGMDYAFLTEQLNNVPEYIATIDQLRYGAFLLMSAVLKGYFGLALNGVLICLLINYLYEYNKASDMPQHSIHKLPTINAFQTRGPEHNWPQHELATPLNRGRSNNAFIFDEDQSRNLGRSDTYPNSNQSFNRSESWQHQPQYSSSPFSYTQEVRRSAKQPSAPVAPAVTDPWRQEPWKQGPPIPMPDYSPQQQRRLKSALKPAS